MDHSERSGAAAVLLGCRYAALRDMMREKSKAPKTLNRRISSLSSFYKYLAGAAAEFRLSINVPNPAHAQFIARESSDPLEGTRAHCYPRAPGHTNLICYFSFKRR
jgi:hypothetical protein